MTNEDAFIIGILLGKLGVYKTAVSYQGILKEEKSKHLAIRTISVSQHEYLGPGQMRPDNRGCTVIYSCMRIGSPAYTGSHFRYSLSY